MIILLATGCSTSTPVASDREWCDTVRAELDAVGVGWPVANRPLTARQLDQIRDIFERAGDDAQGDLQIAVRAWRQGYEAALPYLRIDDEQAFESNTSEDMKSQFHLANIALTNICRWFDDEGG